MSTWKAVERKVAGLLGGRRVPVSGRQRGDSPDVEHDFYSIEVKHREALPEWIIDAMRQAEASKTGDKMPLVVLHSKGMKYEDSLAIVKLSDLITLRGEVKP